MISVGDIDTHSLLSQIPGLFYVLDLKGIVRYCTPSFVDVFSSDSDLNDVLGLDIYTLSKRSNWPPGVARKIDGHNKYVINFKQTIKVVEVVFIDGEKCYWSSKKVPIFDDNHENVIAIACSSADITPLKESESKIKIANQALLDANIQRKEFIENMSHQIRTPITSILHVEQLIKMHLDSSQVNKYVEMIGMAVKELEEFTSQAMTFIGKEVEEKNRFRGSCLSALSHSLIALLMPAATDKGLTLTLDLDSNLPEVIKFPRDVIYNVLLNLISNAIKFTTEGSVQLAVRCYEADLIRFSVKDTGKGIAEVDLGKIFDIHQRIDVGVEHGRGYSGAGMGLFLVKQLLESENIGIKVVSKAQVGTEFSFMVPLTEVRNVKDDQEHDKGSEQIVVAKEVLGRHQRFDCHEGIVDQGAFVGARADENNGGGLVELRVDKKVLLVDDSDIVLQATGAYLKSLFPQLLLETASSGADALLKLAKEQYDLVLIDIGLPDISGSDVVKIYRKQETELSLLPIVALTGHVAELDRDEYLQYGFSEVLLKPLNEKDAYRIFRKFGVEPMSHAL